jgi:pimeloyl-ACP methyl ester carboxylesterase
MYPAGLPHITTRSLPLPNGIGLRLLESGPAAGPPVVLVHGWGACIYTFRYTVEALAAAGYRVVAFDLRGHGLSDKPAAPDAYRLEALLADLEGVLETLRLGAVHLIGHSLGGGVALHFALRNPDRVRRLVLAAPVGLTSITLQRIASLVTPTLTARFARYLPPRWLTSFLIRGAYGDPGRVTDAVIDQYWAPSQFPNYFRAVRGLIHRFNWRPLRHTELAALRSSTLVILGTSDRLIRGAEQSARKIPAASIVSIEGAGHLGIEECPDRFNALVRQFLA